MANESRKEFQEPTNEGSNMLPEGAPPNSGGSTGIDYSYSNLPVVTWDELIASARLPDGEVIQARVVVGGGSGLQLTLATPASVNWWKGVEVFGEVESRLDLWKEDIFN